MGTSFKNDGRPEQKTIGATQPGGSSAIHSGVMNKKVKISIDGVEVLKKEKPIRESFECTTCGQIGHMRTKKNCHKSMCGKHLNNASGKSISLNPSSRSLSKTRTNKVTPESSAAVESSRVENLDSSPKVPKLKFTCGSNKVKPENAPVESQEASVVISYEI